MELLRDIRRKALVVKHWWAEGGVILPVFDIIGGAIQHLFGLSKLPFVKDDGYTYVKDLANKGTDRLQLQGVKNIFDGVDGKITIPHSGSLSFGNGTVGQPFSISGFFNTADIIGNVIINKGVSGSDIEFQVWLNNSSKLRFQVFDLTTTNYLQADSTNIPSIGVNIQWFATYDGSGNSSGINIYYYEVGSLVSGAVVKTTSGTYVAMEGNTSPLYVGGTSTAFFTGDIWNVRVHNNVLTQAQIDLLVANPNTLLGTEVAIYKMDEGAGLTSFDSVSQDNILPSYESDFSVDTDGWADIANTVVTSQQSVGGLNNNLKIAATGGNVVHDMGNSSLFTIGRNHNISLQYYIPSSNVSCDSIRITNLISLIWEDNNPTLDTWNTMPITSRIASSAQIRIYMEDGGEQTFDGDGDVIYIRTVNITSVVEEGKHGTISGGVTWGTQDVVSFQNYDGYSEGLHLSTDTIATVSQGEGFLQAAGDYFDIAFNTINTTLSLEVENSNSGVIVDLVSAGRVRVYDSGALTGVSNLGFTSLSEINKVRITRLGTGYDVIVFHTNGTQTSGTELTFNASTLVFNQIDDLFGVTPEAIYRYINNNGTIYNAENNWNGITWAAGTQTEVLIPSQTATLDVFGEALTYTGKAPKDGRLVQSHCGTFDGVGDYIDTGVVITGNDVEISGRFMTSASGLNNTLIDGRDALSDGVFIQLNTSNQFEIRVNTGTYAHPNTYNDGLWHSYTVSYDGSVAIAIVDGVEIINQAIVTTINVTNSARIGVASYVPSLFFNGQQSDVSISLSGIVQAHYPLAEGAGLVAYDVSGNGNHGTITATEAAFWANTQDLYHYNLLNGFTNTIDMDYVTYGLLTGGNGTATKGSGLTWELTETVDGGFGIRISFAENDINVVIEKEVKITVSNLDLNGASSLSADWSDDLSISITDNGVYFLQSPTLGVGNNFLDFYFVGGKVGSFVNVEVDYVIVDGTNVKSPVLSMKGTDTNPSGKWHNGAETLFMPNPLNDPELIYRAELDDTITRHNSDGIAVPEFMNNEDLAKSKDYVVYDKNITAEQADLVDEAIKYAWDASELKSNVARTLVSEWDVQEASVLLNDVEAIKDELATDSIIKSFDWSLGVDSILATAATLEYNQIVEGESGWLKVTLSGGNVEHNIRQNGVIGIAENIARYTGRIYIPSSNTKIDGVMLSEHIATKKLVSPVLDSIETFDSGYFSNLNGNMRLLPYDGAANIVDSDGDVFYIKDLVVYTRATGFTQPTTTTQPILSGSGKTSVVEYDGIQQFMSQPVTPANFQDLTYFEWWGVIDFDFTNKGIFVFQESGVILNNGFQIFIDNTNDVLVFNNNNASSSQGARSTVALSSGEHIIGIVANGTTYKIFVDNIEVSLTAIGANNGKFLGDLINKTSIDLLTIAARIYASNTYYPNKEKYGLAIGGLSTAAATTAAERINIQNNINKKYNLGL